MNSHIIGSTTFQYRRQILLYLLIWSILALSLGLVVIQVLDQRYLEAQTINVTYEIGELRARLEGGLTKNLQLLYAMGVYFSTHEQVGYEEFNGLCSALLRQSESMRNMAVAQNFTVKWVYPLEGNESVVGLNYTKFKGQWDMVRIARDTGRMTLAGPVNLVQGGHGLIARVPVFKSQNDHFWGLVSSVIDFDDFLNQCGIFEETGTLRIALRGRDGSGENGDVFWGDPALFAKTSGSITTSVSLPYGSWQMAAIPCGGWILHSPYRIWTQLTIFFMGLLGFSGTLYRLRSKMALIDSEHRLKAMSVASIDALIMIDAQDHILFWNPAAEEMFGYKAEEVIGRQFHHLVVKPDQLEAIYAGLKNFGKSGKGPVMDRVLEMEAVRRSGEVFYVERSVASFLLKGKWHAVGSLRDITERKEAEELLREMATSDALTGLANRRYFLEQAELQVRQALRYRKNLSFIMFDLDHFKQINDTHGHDVGDKVLQAVAKAVRQGLREVDIVGRIGGEEFAVVLPETGLEAGRKAGERIRKVLMETTVETENGPINFTVSLGLAPLDSGVVSIAELMKRADQALYQAKGNGRNQVAVFSG